MRISNVVLVSACAGAQAAKGHTFGQFQTKDLHRRLADSNTIMTQDDDRFCVGISQNGLSNNQAVVLKPCVGGATAKWRLEEGSLKTGPNMCLDVPDGCGYDGAAIQIYSCFEGNTNQQFVHQNGQIQWQDTDLCLDVKDGQFTDEAPLQLWTCIDGNTHQAFSLDGSTTPRGCPK